MCGSLPAHSLMKGVFICAESPVSATFLKILKRNPSSGNIFSPTCITHSPTAAATSFGTYLDTHVGLSHARLSIRDIAGGSQPIIRQDGERTCAIVYNGEIYNTDELLPPLLAAGYTFSTTSDTEVILCAYLHYGRDFVSRLNGIFAFAIWDGGTGELLLYRDRAGTKPLFYSTPGGTLVFGSEPKALFCHPDITPAIDENSLLELLSIGPARTPGNGIFSGMHEVLPGHYQIFSREGMEQVCYWDLTAAPHTDSYEKTVEMVSYLVRDAVKRQDGLGRPVCTFLSGGIDSSIVTAIAAGCMQKDGQTLNTFSFDFAENDKYFQSNAFQPERDLPYVNIMLAHCQTHHTYLECSQSTLYEALFSAVDARDLPGMTDVDASLLYFCSLVARHNKVTLTGECADEIFGGYPWFYRPELLNRDGFPWSADVSARAAFLSGDVTDRLDLAGYSRARYEETISASPKLPGESPEEARRRAVGYLNIKWFMQTLLDRMDRTSMYSGLEALRPFARPPHHGVRLQRAVEHEVSERRGKNAAARRLRGSASGRTAAPQKKPVPEDLPPGLREASRGSPAPDHKRSERARSTR